jgi:hypothetical protein
MASASGFVPPKQEEQLKALGLNPSKEYLNWEGDFEGKAITIVSIEYLL